MSNSGANRQQRAGGDRSLVGRLLQHAATGAPLGPAGWRFDSPPGADDERQLRWIIDGGLGPMLHRAVAAHGAAVPAPWHEALLSADLCARVRHGERVDATLEIIEACRVVGVVPTLLKGISVSEQLYPQEHLRPMTDVDLLIPAAAYAAVEAALLDRGYRRLDFPPLPGHQHGAPLHGRSGVFVELHTGVFAEGSVLRDGSAFGPSGLQAHTRQSLYHGRPVQRLSAPFQLAYIAAAWFGDLTLSRVAPGFVAPLFDAIHLLRAHGPDIRWNEFPEWLDNEMARASLYVMASYLVRYGTPSLPADGVSRLGSSQRLVGPVQRRLMHAALDRYLIGGRRWDLPLPPPVPGRYSLRHQFGKRVLRRPG